MILISVLYATKFVLVNDHLLRVSTRLHEKWCCLIFALFLVLLIRNIIGYHDGIVHVLQHH